MTDTLILVSNDDGVAASGIAALAKAVSHLGKVVVVAPDRERSAAGHSISLSVPLRAVEVMPDWFAVDGTPTDAVYLGIHHLLDKKPSLLVSGINHGANLGNDVTYSGTVSAAMEGTVFGVPSIAFSQIAMSKLGGDFSAQAKFVDKVARHVLDKGLPYDTLLNVNFPPKPDAERYQWTTLGRRRYGEQVDARVDPRGKKYYWIGGDEMGHDDRPGSDCNAVADGYISVSPVHMDLTHYEALTQLKKTTL
jgi:5'-nucleotidase